MKIIARWLVGFYTYSSAPAQACLLYDICFIKFSERTSCVIANRIAINIKDETSRDRYNLEINP